MGVALDRTPARNYPKDSSRFNVHHHSLVPGQRRSSFVRDSENEVSRFRLVDLGSHEIDLGQVLSNGKGDGLFPGARLGILKPEKADAIAVRVRGGCAKPEALTGMNR